MYTIVGVSVVILSIIGWNTTNNVNAEIAAIAAGTTGGDADRMTKLADVLRGLTN